MAIEDYTAYLGKRVMFLDPQEVFRTRTESNIVIHKITGTVSMVSICLPLEESEFLIKETDEFYSFREVTFIEELPNPAKGELTS